MMVKLPRQPANSLIKLPAIGASDIKTVIIEFIKPINLVDWLGGLMSAIIAKATTVDVLAPSPCMNLASSSSSMVSAATHPTAPTVIIVFPINIIFLRP